jgi:hypothetical protein
MWNRKCEVHDEHIETLNINRLESKIQEAQQQMRAIVRGPAECEEGGSWAVGFCEDEMM